MGDVGDFLEGPEFGFVGLSGEFGKLCYVAKNGGVEGTVEHEADHGGRTSFEYVLGSGVVFAEGGIPGGDGTAFGAHLVAEVCGLVGDLKLAPVRGVGDEVSLDGLNDVRGEGLLTTTMAHFLGLSLRPEISAKVLKARLRGRS